MISPRAESVAQAESNLKAGFAFPNARVTKEELFPAGQVDTPAHSKCFTIRLYLRPTHAAASIVVLVPVDRVAFSIAESAVILVATGAFRGDRASACVVPLLLARYLRAREKRQNMGEGEGRALPFSAVYIHTQGMLTPWSDVPSGQTTVHRVPSTRVPLLQVSG